MKKKKWAQHLFKDGSMIGLNEKLLSDYVEWVANKRMKAIGLGPIYPIKPGDNPLPWTMHWLNSSGLQNALKKLRLNPISLEVSSKMSKRIHLRTSSYNEGHMAKPKQYFCAPIAMQSLSCRTTWIQTTLQSVCVHSVVQK